MLFVPGRGERIVGRYKALMVGFVGIVLSPMAAAQSWYGVGNSLTWDLQPRDVVELAASQGHDLDAGYHIRCSRGLNYIVNNPDETCVTPTDAGKWDEALAGQAWDIVTLQPHYDSGSTLSSDTSAIGELISKAMENPANANTRFVVYGTWPRTNEPLETTWWEPLPDDEDDPTMRTSRAYYEALIANVRADHPTADVSFLPVGEVILEVLARAKAGEFTLPDRNGDSELTSSDFYRDQTHMHDIGRVTAAMSLYATIYQQSPEGMALPAGTYDNAGRFPDNPDLLAGIQSAAWDVLSNDPLASVPEPGAALLLVGFGLGVMVRLRAR